MTGYLLDTNVISEAAPVRPDRDIAVLRWLEARTNELFLSVVTIAEIEAGITFANHKGAHRKATRLAEWLDAVMVLYGDRVLPMDRQIARTAGKLSGNARAAGLAPGFADIAIAATAVHHGLTVLTRNLRHFEPLGVTVIDPFLEAQT
ncbi:MAG TPA: type II toxin-antitoxin system VapC family toxin [Rhodopila sp.]|nr:type II toxin-antitoxin system VapC family toxin [Rhodopila sp.]